MTNSDDVRALLRVIELLAGQLDDDDASVLRDALGIVNTKTSALEKPGKSAYPSGMQDVDHARPRGRPKYRNGADPLVRLSTVFPESLKVQLQAACDERGWSFAQGLRVTVSAWLDSQETPQPARRRASR